MLLREFITETLTDIVEGIAEAQGKVAARGAIIAPDSRVLGGTAGNDFVNIGGNHYPTRLVQFDIAVAAQNRNEAGAGAGISVLGIELLRADATTEKAESRVSRISFAVNVLYPASDPRTALIARGSTVVDVPQSPDTYSNLSE